MSSANSGVHVEGTHIPSWSNNEQANANRLKILPPTISQHSPFTAPQTQDSHLQIINPLAILLKRHTSRIITQDDDIKQRNLDEIQRDFLGQSPFRCDSVQSAGLSDSSGDLFEGLGRVESLEALLSGKNERLCLDVRGYGRCLHLEQSERELGRGNRRWWLSLLPWGLGQGSPVETVPDTPVEVVPGNPVEVVPGTPVEAVRNCPAEEAVHTLVEALDSHEQEVVRTPEVVAERVVRTVPVVHTAHQEEHLLAPEVDPWCWR